VELSAREVPREPGVDGAEGELAALGVRAQAGHLESSHSSLVAEKYGSTTRPVFA